MPRTFKVLALACCATAAVAVGTRTLIDIPPATSMKHDALKGKPLEMFSPYIGNWEINDRWSTGETLWARNEYRVLMNGAFVEATTWAKDGDRPPYARYRTIFAWDPEAKSLVSHGFTMDGTAETHRMEMLDADGSTAISAEWPMSDAENAPSIRQHVHMPKDGSYRWQVWMVPAGGGDPAVMIDGEWIRVP